MAGCRETMVEHNPSRVHADSLPSDRFRRVPSVLESQCTSKTSTTIRNTAYFASKRGPSTIRACDLSMTNMLKEPFPRSRLTSGSKSCGAQDAAEPPPPRPPPSPWAPCRYFELLVSPHRSVQVLKPSTHLEVLTMPEKKNPELDAEFAQMLSCISFVCFPRLDCSCGPCFGLPSPIPSHSHSSASPLTRHTNRPYTSPATPPCQGRFSLKLPPRPPSHPAPPPSSPSAALPVNQEPYAGTRGARSTA